MQLSLEDVDQFFRLHGSLMFYVNRTLKVLDTKAATPEDYSRLPPEDRIRVHEALLENRGLIGAFADADPFKLSDEDQGIVRSWSHLVSGKFYAFRQLAKSMVFLSTTAPAAAYGVVALFDPFEVLIGPVLPRMVKATLLPFKGQIVHDGILSAYNITFGPGIKRRLNEDYKEAKARFGIITSLAVEQGAPAKPVKAPEGKAKTKAGGKKRESHETEVSEPATGPGETSKRLHSKLGAMARPLKLPTHNQPGRPDMPSIQKFIEDGLDPVHAAYAFVQHITSYFAEGVSQLAEMKAWAKFVGEAEEEYLPSGPPMSPLTGSFFTTWALYDLRIGGGPDTLGSCLIDSNDVVRMNPHQLEALKKLCGSRMGIYEHVGADGPHIRLRELITDDELTCLPTSGYRGRKGELWYVRLLPPLEPELAAYQIVFTTPYVLTKTSRSDWVRYLKRMLVQFPARSERESLHALLKYGPVPKYWCEFVVEAYHHPQPGAIFLAGIPDLKDTLPHA